MANVKLDQTIGTLTTARTYAEAKERQKAVQHLGYRQDTSEYTAALVAHYTACVSDHARNSLLFLLELSLSDHAKYIAYRKQLTGE